METQTGNYNTCNKPSQEDKPPQPTTVVSQSSRSVPSLRFPIPQGNQNLANWISSSLPNIMSSSSSQGDSGLSDSAFEFINHELEVASQESQDARTDDLSVDLDEDEKFPHPDEVHSVDDTASRGASDSEEEEDDEEEDEKDVETLFPYASSLRYADEALDNPSTHGRFPAYFAPPTPTRLMSSIKFTKPSNGLHFDTISVKHTVRELNEEETAEVTQHMKVANPSKRLFATIKQTMSASCLSTHEAFRVMYVGDEAVKWEIVNKISRAIACSSSTDYNENKTLFRNTDGVYNIVPISFGSCGNRDVELMEVSKYQIKVETCTTAEEVVDDAAFFFGPSAYSLTIEGGDGATKYKSMLISGGAQIQPAWNVPHIAIFYCSDNDDDNLRETQDVAWKFCNRHGIRSIFISEHSTSTQSLSGLWHERVDEHAVHLSLESRDPETPIPEQRLPIDVTSFLKIDNRQMNQNLTFLTGLQDPRSAAKQKLKDATAFSGVRDWSEHEFLKSGFISYMNQLRQDDVFMKRAFEILLALLIVLMSTMLVCVFSPISSSSALDSLSPVSFAPTSTAVSTATVTINLTSTKTVRIVSVETPVFGGLLSDKAQATMTSEAVPQSTICSVEMFSGNEILLKLPSGTKTSWLSKGAISVDIHRGNDPIKSRLSTVDEGILIEINKKDANGMLNVSVVTTRKPKINETFTVNFGRGVFAGAFNAVKDIIHDVAQRLGDTADDAAHTIEDNYAPVLALVAQTLKDEAASMMVLIQHAGKAVQDFTSRVSGETVDRVKDSLPAEGFASFFKDAQAVVSNQLPQLPQLPQLQLPQLPQFPSVETFREDADLSILKAQISAKLWWLKVQGKIQEYQQYEQQAKPFLVKKHSEVLEARTLRDTESKPAKCPRTGKKNCLRKDKGTGGKWKSLRG